MAVSPQNKNTDRWAVPARLDAETTAMLDATPYAKILKDTSAKLAEAMLADDAALRAAGREFDRFLHRMLMMFGRHLSECLMEELGQRMAGEASATGLAIERAEVITTTTLFGDITVRSPYLYDEEGLLPSQRPLKDHFGLTGRGYTDAVDRAVSDFGADRAFAGAAASMKEHYHLDLNRCTARRKTEAVAQQAEHYVETRLQQGEERYMTPTLEREEAEVLLAELDGCYLPTARFMTAAEARAEGLELARPQAADTEKVRIDTWVEVRTGVVRPLAVDPTDRKAQQQAKDARTYVCRQDSYEGICHQLYGAACLHELGPQTRVIAPGDGANGLREGLELVFPHLEFRLDPTHLKDNVAKCADALGLKGAARQGWIAFHLDAIWEGRIEEVLEALEARCEEAKAAKASEAGEETEEAKALRRLHNFIDDHQDALNYPAYQAEGTPFGSGEVESAHRYVPQARLKIPGARWRRDNLNPMLALRVIRANGWWDDFWDHERRRRAGFS